MSHYTLKSALISGPAAWIALGLSFTLFVAAGWPGWMSVDSIGMWARATEGPIYDWHSPILIWFWKYVGANSFGPLIPFLVQAALFWFGLVLLVGRLQRLGWTLAWLIFPGAIFLDATWTVAWVWKDSLAISILTALVGLAASTDISGLRRWVWPLAAALAALFVATRWYLAPLGLLALISLFFVAFPIPRKTIGITILSFVVITLGLFGFERFIIKPDETYPGGQLMMLDIARVECNIGSAEARRKGDYENTLLPSEFIEHVPGDDICTRYTNYDLGLARIEREQQPTGSSYFLANSDASNSRLTNSWLSIVRQYPGLLAEARIKQMMAFLNSETELWWSPSRQLPVNSLLYLPGSMGDGSTVGFGSMSRAPLVIGAAASYLGSYALLDFGSNLFGLFSLVLIPAFTAAFGWQRGPSWRLKYFPALGFPLVFLLFIAAIAPGADVRYVMPGAIWALAVAVLALADRDPRSQSGKPQGLSPIKSS